VQAFTSGQRKSTVSKRLFLYKNRTMDNVQKVDDNCINYMIFTYKHKNYTKIRGNF
jgi:hypothetical protein